MSGVSGARQQTVALTVKTKWSYRRHTLIAWSREVSGLAVVAYKCLVVVVVLNDAWHIVASVFAVLGIHTGVALGSIAHEQQ